MMIDYFSIPWFKHQLFWFSPGLFIRLIQLEGWLGCKAQDVLIHMCRRWHWLLGNSGKFHMVSYPPVGWTDFLTWQPQCSVAESKRRIYKAWVLGSGTCKTSCLPHSSGPGKPQDQPLFRRLRKKSLSLDVRNGKVTLQRDGHIRRRRHCDH